MALRISLIGPGDIPYHYYDLLGLEETVFMDHVTRLAQILARGNAELVLLPDRGVSFELARQYKQHAGKRVLGTVPASDTDFGIAHLTPYMEADVGGKRVFDTFIDTGDWYRQDLTHCIFGDAILLLGMSLGSLGELAYGFYLYKLFTGKKPGVRVDLTRIHPEARAGSRIPYTLLAYEPFLASPLPRELTAYIQQAGGRIIPLREPEDLAGVLQQFEREAENT